MSKEKTAHVITKPQAEQIPQLRALWKEAFGDTDAFLDTFFSTAFSLERCRCVIIDGNLVAALYWFDCLYEGKHVAYIYAVATSNAHRGQGLCHLLMEHTHTHLKEAGYEGALLSPATPPLFDFYAKIGYTTCAYHDEISFTPETLYAYEEKSLGMHPVSKTEFSQLRKQFLPQHALLQEGENLDFLETQADFYQGEHFLLTARKEGDTLFGIEFLGDTAVLPSILAAFACTRGTFRMPGKEKPFGMYYSLTNNIRKPSYFGFAFD